MIVGAKGYIGGHLAHHYETAGVDVVKISSSEPGGINPETGLLPDNFEVPQGVDTVFYLAQSPRHRQAPDMATHLLSVNVLSAIQMASVAHRAGVRKFIYASTGNVYAPSFLPLREDAPLRRDNWYSLSKVHAEEALGLFRNDLDVTIVRLFGVYGPGQQGRLVPNLIRSVLEGKEIQINRRCDGNADTAGLRISLCYVEDTVHILRQIAASGGVPVLNVASDEILSIREMATLIAQAAGKPARFAKGKVNRDSDLIADISRLKQVINPRFTTFQEGISYMLNTPSAILNDAHGDPHAVSSSRAL